jgi:hypothetical protein
MDEPYIRWSAIEVTLFPDLIFLLKVNTPLHVSQPIYLLALHDKKDSNLRLLCVWQALRHYLTAQPNIANPGHSNCLYAMGDRPVVFKSRIYSSLVELITWVYSHQGLPVPQGIKWHNTWKQSTSIVDIAGVDPQQIC